MRRTDREYEQIWEREPRMNIQGERREIREEANKQVYHRRETEKRDQGKQGRKRKETKGGEVDNLTRREERTACREDTKKQRTQLAKHVRCKKVKGQKTRSKKQTRKHRTPKMAKKT